MMTSADPSVQDSPSAQASTVLDAAVLALREAAADPERTAELDPRALQALLCEAVRIYSRKLEAGEALSPFPGSHGRGDTPTASEVCLTAVQMLDAVSVEVFELAMFKTWAAIQGGDAQ
ncbi:hypothetical protein [Pseudonocardia pini]|uniref:hypothetical protein n=1 Tax=Pseudonocardia pini TaxID=2758030 RepID=UPI0015F099E7|nr:hypothetical protein [Pseudonocardia pini]